MKIMSINQQQTIIDGALSVNSPIAALPFSLITGIDGDR